MDEMAMAVLGAAAAATVMGKGLRPMAKLAMRGAVTVAEATSAGRRGVQQLYTEVKTEREQRVGENATADARASDPAPGASPASG